MQMDRALSVSELNEYVRRLLAGDALLRNVVVSGEISCYKHHISGHRYFSLKDAGARVQCVMFRQSAMGLQFQPQDGMRVRVQASASLFARDGSYQLYVSSMQKEGVGDLYQKFEALKRKLTAEGLFDPAIKRELPLMPRCIGIATSRTGAALRDMVRIARRRNPHVGIIVAPCSVQGSEAVGEIVRALDRLNRDGRPDVILLGRGGGSIEDLWAFNEEAVARAIAASRIPVVSCVGHETDFTISDFVADVRAATPSMAAEIAVPVLADLQRSLNTTMRRVSAGLMQGNRLRRAELMRVCASPLFFEPARILIEGRRSALNEAWDRCWSAQRTRMERLDNRLGRLADKLDALNPAGVLDRGYAYVTRAGAVCASVDALKDGDQVVLHLRDGRAEAQILSTTHTEKEEHGNKAEL